MKHLTLSALFLSLVAFVGIPAASARPIAPDSDAVSAHIKQARGRGIKMKMQSHMKRVRHARMLKRFDANSDGTLDKVEKAAAKEVRQARRAEMKARFDANRDGKLDAEERKARKLDHKARKLQRKLDKIEKKAARDA